MDLVERLGLLPKSANSRSQDGIQPGVFCDRVARRIPHALKLLLLAARTDVREWNAIHTRVGGARRRDGRRRGVHTPDADVDHQFDLPAGSQALVLGCRVLGVCTLGMYILATLYLPRGKGHQFIAPFCFACVYLNSALFFLEHNIYIFTRLCSNSEFI